ncbi:MAG: DUF4928 family protein [Chitinophagales bacterium]|nr:DUF4928 family protein [Chitinophagales bacterium]
MFEEFWSSVEPEIEDGEDFLKTATLILDVLKSKKDLDFNKFYDDAGEVKSYYELCKLRKIPLAFDPKLSTWQIIHDLFETSHSEGKAGYVAQHLVGAKLQLRFPNEKVSNESASTADRPTNRSGDFAIGNTVFHVTVSPMEGVYKKCQDNIKEGLKVYLIVPDAKLAAARQLGEQYCNGHIAVESLESFISQNIEEISVFAAEKLKHNLVSLVKIYNERVNAVEVDKSLMIELPSNLEKYNG